MIYKGKIIEKGVYCKEHGANVGCSILNKYKDAKIEINIYVMREGYSFYFRPPLDEKSIKTYYILEGQLYNYDTECHYSSGDIVVLDYQSEPFNFDVKKNIRVLVQSTHDNSYETSSRSFELINETLAKVNLKDSYTSEHSKRVYLLTRLMAMELNYSGQKLFNILNAAKYHDVGKIYIKDSILNKPSSLTQDEFEVMKSHVIYAKELIETGFNQQTYTIISQHHERIDGSGYPLGLKDEEITEEGKIIAICDSFDAMTTDRVYKRGKTIEEAVIELKELSGLKYDPRLISLFIDKVIPKYLDRILY